MSGLDGLGDVSVDRTPAPEQIAAVLRERIIGGDLAPGTPLTETRLAAAFSVSRNTVREALALLSRDGITTQNSYRGVAVSVMTEDDVHDIFRLRRMFELPAVDAALGAGDRLTDLGDRVGALRALDPNSDWRDIVESDLAFHRTLVGMLDSPRLGRLYDQMLTELRLCILIANVDDHESLESLTAQHEELYELLRNGDGEACKAVLARHLEDAEAALIARFSAAAVGA